MKKMLAFLFVLMFAAAPVQAQEPPQPNEVAVGKVLKAIAKLDAVTTFQKTLQLNIDGVKNSDGATKLNVPMKDIFDTAISTSNSFSLLSLQTISIAKSSFGLAADAVDAAAAEFAANGESKEYFALMKTAGEYADEAIAYIEYADQLAIIGLYYNGIALQLTIPPNEGNDPPPPPEQP